MYCVFELMELKKKELDEIGVLFGDVKLEVVEEYVIECVLLKVVGLEVLDFVVDEMVQIYGGMGYFEEGIVVRGY